MYELLWGVIYNRPEKQKIMYLLRRTNQGGGYVSKSGHKSSYVENLQNARKFKTIEEAEKHRCVENEVIEDLERILDMIR